MKRTDSANTTDNLSLRAVPKYLFGVTDMKENGEKWYLDSGCTSHLCNDTAEFMKILEYRPVELNLASSASSKIKARETVKVVSTRNRRM